MLGNVTSDRNPLHPLILSSEWSRGRRGRLQSRRRRPGPGRRVSGDAHGLGRAGLEGDPLAEAAVAARSLSRRRSGRWRRWPAVVPGHIHLEAAASPHTAHQVLGSQGAGECGKQFAGVSEATNVVPSTPTSSHRRYRAPEVPGTARTAGTPSRTAPQRLAQPLPRIAAVVGTRHPCRQRRPPSGPLPSGGRHRSIRLLEEQAHREHEVDHHPSRQQPTALLGTPSPRDHLKDQLRRERPPEHPNPTWRPVRSRRSSWLGSVQLTALSHIRW